MPQAANCSFCCSKVYSSMTQLCPGNRRFFLFTACAHAAQAVTFCCSTKSNQKRNQKGRHNALKRRCVAPFGIPITTPHFLRWKVPLSVTAAPCQLSRRESHAPAALLFVRKADAPGLFSVLCAGIAVRGGFPDAGNSPVGGNVT